MAAKCARYYTAEQDGLAQLDAAKRDLEAAWHCPSCIHADKGRPDLCDCEGA